MLLAQPPAPSILYLTSCCPPSITLGLDCSLKQIGRPTGIHVQAAFVGKVQALPRCVRGRAEQPQNPDSTRCPFSFIDSQTFSASVHCTAHASRNSIPASRTHRASCSELHAKQNTGDEGARRLGSCRTQHQGQLRPQRGSQACLATSNIYAAPRRHSVHRLHDIQGPRPHASAAHEVEHLSATPVEQQGESDPHTEQWHAKVIVAGGK